ncbi:nif11-like leader peptide domain protein [Synechococcus sp. BIOS-E4-1]|uniref:Nif11-like leader peptide family natural product precursor n=1 Tax=Synechococcus sp. BIOS-E4-1 TaxID=1400864 RepID=UPI00164533C1|nr:Nif11-like leader peptide family natural product precursor [Synechococcus sp. BIOS-E4-1]QNI54378.1 nif11-like leader peptide domain protein [Synechococcus sp. BIOS-E4-1]
MSEEQLKAFLEKVKGDTILQEKLKAAADADAVRAIAKEAGFSISADDLKNVQQSELSAEELETVAGGSNYYRCHSCWNKFSQCSGVAGTC